jgi:hypothetical protein
MLTDAVIETLRSMPHIDDIRQVAREVPASQLAEYLYNADSRVARNAGWALTHKSNQEINTLPQDRLVDFVLTTPDSSLRRLTLNLIERQGIQKDAMRTDLLDFCLQHMAMLEEPPGVQSLCLKVAYQMCRYYPELQHELNETLNLMQTEHYKPGMKSLIKKLKKQILQ